MSLIRHLSCRSRALAAALVPAVAVGLMLLASPLVRANPSLISSAKLCSELTGQMDRLACYDRVFAEPVDASRSEAVGSERWRLALAQADRQSPGEPLQAFDHGRRAGWMVTVTARGRSKPAPVLMAQCHNNITELALLLNRPLAEERIAVEWFTTDGEGTVSSPEIWRVRDNGLLVSAGRGLPAIRMILSLARQDQWHLTTRAASLDGLEFDLRGLAQALQPLRSACGW